MARLRKKDQNYFMENFGEKCEENQSSLQSQRGFILVTLYNEKTSDRSLYLRLRIIERKSILIRETIRDSCTREQVGLFCNFHDWLPSHSWKLRNSPICSRVQFTLYVSRTDRFPIQVCDFFFFYWMIS